MGKIILFVFILFVGGAIFLFSVFNKSILRYESPRWVRTIVQLINSPEDLYVPLVVEEVEKSDGSVVGTIYFSNKYSGRHVAGFFHQMFGSEDYLEYQEDSSLLSGVLKFYIDDVLVYSHSIGSNEISPFIKKGGGGIHFMMYNVPKDMPLDKMIRCDYSLENVDILGRGYEPVKLFFGKLSDI